MSAGLLNLRRKSNTNQSVVGFELLQGLRRIVHERETGRLAATELSLQTENIDLVLVGLVHLGELRTEFILGDVGAVWVENVTVNHQVRTQSSILPVCLIHSSRNSLHPAS